MVNFFAAHHQWDPVTKETFNFTLTFVPRNRMKVFSTSESGKPTILADMTHRNDGSHFQATYIHSLWLTESIVIVPESPLIYQQMGKNLILNGSVLSLMSWVENVPTYLHVIRRTGGLVASIPAPAFFTFHVGNAFDSIDPTTGDIILTLDSASFTDGDVMNQLHDLGTPRRKGTQPVSSTPSTRINGMAHPPKQQTEYGNYMHYKLNVTQSKIII